MGLEELGRQGLLLPEDRWGDQPDPSWRSRAQILVCGVLFVVAAVLIWVGQGSWVTFVGLGIFFVALLLFLVFTFRAVDHQVRQLLEMGAGGEVEGLAAVGEAARPAEPEEAAGEVGAAAEDGPGGER